MPNRKYEQGRRKEYKICADLREQGYDLVQRAAGSHSAVDVFAIKKADRSILLVQSKGPNMTESQKEKLARENEWLNGKFDVEFSVE